MGIKSTIKKFLPESILRLYGKIIFDYRFIKLKRKIDLGQKSCQEYGLGINLIGPIRAAMGLGQSCRLLADILDHTKYEFAIKEVSLGNGVRNLDHTYDSKICDDMKYNINIFHIEPFELMSGAPQMGEKVWNGRYNIAFWLWEIEKFPKAWKKSFDLIDEIWTPSEFTSSCLRKYTNKPIYTIPYCVSAPTDEKYGREYFDLPQECFLFLCMYDTNSTMERKNPSAVIKAFQQAFSSNDNHVGLVLKMNNPKSKDIELIEEIVGEYKNVYLITDVMDKIVVNSLIKCVDVFVSLHRAEGFGLVMAEAMLNGTPCIATNWSSNTEFMNDEVACMVDYQFVTLKKAFPPYEKGIRWADPNVGHAAYYMKKLYQDGNFYYQIANRAKKYIETKLGMQSAVELVQQRIDDINKRFIK